MSKGKILFIDDDNFLRKVYQTELSEKGFEVSLAVDGEDGLHKVAEVKPDLIILDLIMPKKNGFEVIADLQRYDETKTIPIIVLSNLAQSEDQQRALNLGASDYLVKDNTTLDVIASKIEYHLHAAQVRGTSAPARPAGQSLATALVQKKQQGTLAQTEQTKASGSAVTAKKERGHNFCPQCGYKINTKVKFCPDCGAPVNL